MNAVSSPGSPSEKRAVIPGWAAILLNLLRMYWFTVLALLIVVFLGLRGGWTTPRQWSDGFFFAAAAQIIAAAVTMISPPGEALDASALRYIDDSDINETRKDLLALDWMHKQRFGVRMFIGAGLTLLVSGACLIV